MNTKSLLTRIGVPVLSLGLLGGIGATLATSASAATLPAAAALSANVKLPTTTAVTHVNNVPDTTSGTVTSDPGTGNGPVWAYDNLAKQFKVTETASGFYTVVVTVHGTFRAFSQPNTGLSYDSPINVTGSIDGTNTYYVQSSTAPDPSNLPAQESDGTGTGTMIGQLFHSAQVDQGGNSGNLWVFTYKAGGDTMTQTYQDPTGATWGNITG
jgi:hypothetical protein